jgi:hypothetical protein
MTLILLLSLPFAVLGCLIPRWRIAMVPFVVWSLVAWLGEAGMVPYRMSGGFTLILVSGIGAIYSIAGTLMARARRLRRV